ncbi:TRAP transporter large permease subunit [Thermococcus litoralis]|nr:TRAP transporter large permease subunit [Thermococcus litoralis]
MACWIMAGGSAFSSVFSGIGGKKLVVDLLLSLPAAKITVLVFSLALIFFLGMFVDPVSIIMIMTPILTPAVTGLGYDPLWWGVAFTSMLLVSYLTPPVGLGLYYFKGAIEEVSMDEIYRAVIPFIVLQVIAIIVIILKPGIVLWFINILFRT